MNFLLGIGIDIIADNLYANGKGTSRWSTSESSDKCLPRSHPPFFIILAILRASNQTSQQGMAKLRTASRFAKGANTRAPGKRQNSALFATTGLS